MAAHPIDVLVKQLARLPGLGPRSAKRAVLHLLQNQDRLMTPLIQSLVDVQDHVFPCNICGNLDVQSPCNICSDPAREAGLICVVETVADLWAFERARRFHGQYHVLGGVLSALDGRGPEDLGIERLVTRCKGLLKQDSLREVLLATNLTVEGKTTALYIHRQLEDIGVSITRLGHGIPVGGELDYLDSSTLAAAFEGRQQL